MRIKAILAILPFLAACGGGSPTPPAGPPANTAPQFTSPAVATVTENSLPAYQAAASDADGQPVTFAIAGGADAAKFDITPAGALSFVAPPNYEAPGDLNGDNVYEVRLQASDGAATTTMLLSVTLANDREGIAVRRVATGFDQPVHIAAIPGSRDILVAQKGGAVYRLDPVTGQRSLAFAVSDISTDGERGLLGLVATDRFLSEQSLFAVVTAADGAVEIREYSLVGRLDFFGNPTHLVRTVLRIPHPDFNNHNGGWIGYGPDGHVYVGVGDGGGSGDPGGNAQSPSSRLGKILRFTRNPDPFAGASPQFYMPAPGNPFIGGGGDPYVFALGLRNPFRASFSGDHLIIGDVGQSRREEIDLVRIDQPGANFGWPFLEGTTAFAGTPPPGLVGPVSEYEHGSGPYQGRTIIGGHVYRGAVPSLRSFYVFGDFISGNIWTVSSADLLAGGFIPSSRYERRNEDFAPDAGTIDQLVSFGEDADANLFLIDLDGDIFQVVPG